MSGEKKDEGGRRRPTALARKVEELRWQGFDWRERNCGLVAGDLLLAYCGVDYASAFRRECDGPLSACRALAKAGGLEAALRSAGFEPVAANYAQRGDLATLEMTAELPGGRDGGDLALGCVVDQRAAFAGPTALTLLPVAECRGFWRAPVLRTKAEG